MTIQKVRVAAYQRAQGIYIYCDVGVFFFYSVTAQYRALAYCSSGFETCDVLQEELVGPSPYPNLEEQARYLWPLETGWSSYTPRH